MARNNNAQLRIHYIIIYLHIYIYCYVPLLALFWGNFFPIYSATLKIWHSIRTFDPDKLYMQKTCQKRSKTNKKRSKNEGDVTIVFVLGKNNVIQFRIYDPIRLTPLFIYYIILQQGYKMQGKLFQRCTHLLYMQCTVSGR